MSGNKVVKSVSFNVTNEEDREYLESIQNVNFSGYVKRLIEEDIRQQEKEAENNVIQQPTFTERKIVSGSNGLAFIWYDLFISSTLLCNTVMQLSLSMAREFGMGMRNNDRRKRIWR